MGTLFIFGRTGVKYGTRTGRSWVFKGGGLSRIGTTTTCVEYSPFIVARTYYAFSPAAGYQILAIGQEMHERI